MPLTRFFSTTARRRRERRRARDVQKALFASSDILSRPLVQRLYRQMGAALVFNAPDPGNGTAPPQKIVVLDGYDAQQILAAEFLLLKRYLFPEVDAMQGGFLQASATRRIYFSLYGTIIRCDYCPAHGHLGNYRAYIFSGGAWVDLTCDQFDQLINGIVNQPGLNPVESMMAERMIYDMLSGWSSQGRDIIAEYGGGAPNANGGFDITLRYSYGTQRQLVLTADQVNKLRFYFFFLTVKEVSRRMGVRDYYKGRRGQNFSVGNHNHYGKDVAFAYFIAMAIKLVQAGRLPSSAICAFRSNYGLHSGSGVTRTSRLQPAADGLGRTKERAMRVAEEYHRSFGGNPVRLVTNDVVSVFSGVYRDPQRPAPQVVRTQAAREDAWSDDEVDHNGVCIGRPT